MEDKEESKSAEPEKSERVNGPSAGAEEPMVYCPRCNARLLSERCKLVCKRCGYYMSCADYY